MFIGIDPGLSGGIAFLRADGALQVDDLPTVQARRGNKRELDLAGLVHLIRERAGAGADAVVERVGAMPGQGVSSMFNFGATYGGIRGVLAGLSIPVTLVTPQEWKKALRVPAAKDAARARASELLPRYACCWQRVKDDGRAEAALLAVWLRNASQSSFARDLLS